MKPAGYFDHLQLVTWALIRELLYKIAVHAVFNIGVCDGDYFYNKDDDNNRWSYLLIIIISAINRRQYSAAIRTGV